MTKPRYSPYIGLEELGKIAYIEKPVKKYYQILEREGPVSCMPSGPIVGANNIA